MLYYTFIFLLDIFILYYCIQYCIIITVSIFTIIFIIVAALVIKNNHIIKVLQRKTNESSQQYLKLMSMPAECSSR